MKSNWVLKLINLALFVFGAAFVVLHVEFNDWNQNFKVNNVETKIRMERKWVKSIAIGKQMIVSFHSSHLSFYCR